MLFKKVHAIIILLSGVCAILSYYFEHDFLYYFLKPITTVLILLFSLIHGHRSEKEILKMTVYGLFFCLLGDILLMKDTFFVYGLLAFLVAHILFIISFVKIDGFKNYFKPFVLLLLFGGMFYAFLYPNLGSLALRVLVYVICIALMAWQGAGLYIWKKKKPFLYILLGALLFMISDSIIALNKFVYSFELSKLVVMTTYWTAIFFIAKASTMRKKVL